MLHVDEADVDRISEAIYRVLQGKAITLVELPDDYPDNEIKQAVTFLNQLLTRYDQFARALQLLSTGELDFELPRDRMAVFHSLKNLQANLRHLTWKTQKIAEGDLSLQVDFLGDLSEAFNHMTALLKQAFARIEDMSLTDELTQLANRRHFNEALAREWARAHRSGLAISLLLLDIDHFKLYNDHYGHQAGDACLQQVARAVAAAARRSTDLAARYGGEEFAIILPDTPAAEAVEVAARVHRGLAQANMPHAASRVADHVTASIGVASARPGPDDPAEALVKAADDRLYQAKEQGRNRTATDEI